ncbi:hypothetical protein [Actinocrispum sp. NPDC049592]|uniref:hypothetical protein n=1 Tax=Actinocrispum sp. NPDC049592 TaxID=3154835 RepID=UPI003440893E
MNRSVERTSFPIRGTTSGQVIVAPFVHPVRGPVHCPAAALIAASLRDHGLDVRRSTRSLTVGPGPADGVLVNASYLDRGGQAVGFAVAVHLADEMAIAIANEVVHGWSDMWRTRRVMVAGTGFTSDSCTCPGPLGGYRTQEDEVSCAHAEIMSAEIDRFRCDGDHVVVIGKREDVAQPANTSETTVVESADEVAGIEADPERIGYVVSPNVVVEDAALIIAALRARFPRIRGQHPAGFCYGPSDRAASVRAVAAAAGSMLVLGTAGSADTTEVTGLAASGGTPVQVIDHPARISRASLRGVECIGIAVARSSPPWLCQDVVEILSGLGPLSVVSRTVCSETVGLDTRSATNKGDRDPAVVPLPAGSPGRYCG